MKKIISLLCAAVMIFSSAAISVTASAAGYTSSLLDYADLFTADEEIAIRELMSHTASISSCNVGVLAASDLEGRSPIDYAEKCLYDTFGEDSDSIVLLIANDFDADENYDWIAVSGTAADRYAFSINDIFDDIYSLYDSSGYVGMVAGFCNYLNVDNAANSGSQSQSSGNAKIDDLGNRLTTSDEDVLTEYLDPIAADIGCCIGIVITDDLQGKNAAEYAEQYAAETFPDMTDIVVLLLNNDSSDEATDYLYISGAGMNKFGGAAEAISAHICDGLGAPIYDDPNDYSYYSAVINLGISLNGINIDGENSYYYNYTSIYSDAPAAGHIAVLDDLDDMLSAEEEADLLEYLQPIAKDIKCSIGVVITDDLQGKSDSQYAEDYAREAFPYGTDLVVLLLNNDRSNMDYVDWIYTYGLGTEKYDGAIDAIFDHIYDGMGIDYYEDLEDYDYYSGIINFGYSLQDISENGEYSYYYDYHSDDNYYDDGDGIDLIALLIPFAIGGITTAIVTGSTVKGYKKKAPISARHYMDSNRTRFTNRQDIYLRETTTSVKINSSSGGGGSRGGGGGRSRSGGGGGGGRRR